MVKLEIITLGNFKILANGTDIVPLLETAKKRISLFQYLLLNYDRTVSSLELFHTLWPYDDETVDIKTSLKTMVSRLRSRLSEFDNELASLITTEGNGYRWAIKETCNVDIIIFEHLYSDILGADSPELRKKLCDSALKLYGGNLLPEFNKESWVAQKSTSLEKKFLEIAKIYIKDLKPDLDLHTIKKVCSHVIAITQYDYEINMEYMTVLKELGRPNDAVSYFYKITAKSPLTEQPSEQILQLYKKLVSIDKQSQDNISAIRAELSVEHDAGAFFCDYTIFKELYNLRKNAIKRLGISQYIVIMTICSFDELPLDSSNLNEAMQQLQDVLKTTLRSSDVVAQYNEHQYVLMLSATNSDLATIAIERAKKNFYELNSNDSVIVSYSIGSVLVD